MKPVTHAECKSAAMPECMRGRVPALRELHEHTLVANHTSRLVLSMFNKGLKIRADIVCGDVLRTYLPILPTELRSAVRRQIKDLLGRSRGRCSSVDVRLLVGEGCPNTLARIIFAETVSTGCS